MERIYKAILEIILKALESVKFEKSLAKVPAKEKLDLCIEK